MHLSTLKLSNRTRSTSCRLSWHVFICQMRSLIIYQYWKTKPWHLHHQFKKKNTKVWDTQYKQRQIFIFWCVSKLCTPNTYPPHPVVELHLWFLNSIKLIEAPCSLKVSEWQKNKHFHHPTICTRSWGQKVREGPLKSGNRRAAANNQAWNRLVCKEQMKSHSVQKVKDDLVGGGLGE